MDELTWRLTEAEKAGLIYSVECHVGSIAPTPGDALRLVRKVPGLTLTLDYTHFTRIGLPDSASEPLVAHASHFHVRGAAKGRLQTSFKNNTIDYKRVLKRMKATGYKGYLGVEYVWMDWEHCNEVDNISETVAVPGLSCGSRCNPSPSGEAASGRGWPRAAAGEGDLRPARRDVTTTLDD